jgi:NSS family neurotransmitter:Na+ symporter
VGVIGSAITMCLVVTYAARRLPELQAHLNRVSTARVGRWWRVLVGVVVPLALTVMLVTSLAELVTEPYGGYPWAFVNAVGWGVAGGALLAALALAALRWRRPVDDFAPEPLMAEAVR